MAATSVPRQWTSRDPSGNDSSKTRPAGAVGSPTSASSALAATEYSRLVGDGIAMRSGTGASASHGLSRRAMSLTGTTSLVRARTAFSAAGSDSTTALPRALAYPISMQTLRPV